MQLRGENFMPAGRRGLLMQGTAEEMRLPCGKGEEYGAGGKTGKEIL